MFEKNAPVYIEGCGHYDPQLLTTLLHRALLCVCKEGTFSGKDVVIKPNLVRKMDPERGGTTHPVMLEAMIGVLKGLGARRVCVAESPGGLYNAAALRQVYEGCGIENAVKNAGGELNFDCGFAEMKAPEGKKSKMFEVINPIKDAEIIVNLCKMKSHGMMTQSCAVKNLFGVIPGVKKFEMHARFPDPADFAGMLCDLNEMLYTDKKILNVCDGVISMEGNGPTNGRPRKTGVVLVSENPFCLDLAAAEIMNIKQNPELLQEGISRGYCPPDRRKLNCPKEKPERFCTEDFELPDSSKSGLLKRVLTMDGGRYARFFEPRPQIDEKKCRGCGECLRSCPAHTIFFVENGQGKRVARIRKEHCIKCYCCQELCPFDSVRIHTNFLIRMVNRI